MKIIMLSSDYLPNIGGIAAHIYSLSSALRKMGHEIAIVQPVLRKGGKTEIVREEDEPVYRVFVPADADRARRVLLRTKATLQALQYAISDLGGIDILHQHDLLTSALAARRITTHTTWVWTNHTSIFHRMIKNSRNRLLIKWAYSSTDGIINTSPTLAEKAATLWGKRKLISYIPNGVDLAMFNPDKTGTRGAWGLRDDDFVVLCPGRMIEIKGTLYLAEAVRILIDQMPEVNWRFVFLGSEPAPNTNQEYIEKVKGILNPAFRRGYIRYLGNLKMAEIPSIMSVADIIIIPSLMEAVSLAALEGLASRKVVVATDVGGLPEVIRHGETGLLIPPKEPQAIAEAIINLYQRPDFRSQLAESGHRLVSEKYSWDQVAQRTVDFYSKAGTGA